MYKSSPVLQNPFFRGPNCKVTNVVLPVSMTGDLNPARDLSSIILVSKTKLGKGISHASN